jgi:hypothetical protein
MEEEHQMTLVETIRIEDCLQLTYVCNCGSATRRRFYDKDFTEQGQIVEAKASKNGRKAK